MVRVLPCFFVFFLLLALLCCHHKCKGDFGVATFDDLWLLCRRFLATRTSWHWNPWDRRTLGNTFAVPSCHVLEQGRRRFLLPSMVSCNICMSYTKTGIDTPPRSCEVHANRSVSVQVWGQWQQEDSNLSQDSVSSFLCSLYKSSSVQLPTEYITAFLFSSLFHWMYLFLRDS